MAAAGERYLAANRCHLLGQVQRAQGRLGAAAGTYRLALLVAGIGYVGLAEVAYQWDELDAALGRPRPVTPMSACAGPARITRVRDLGGPRSRGSRPALHAG